MADAQGAERLWKPPIEAMAAAGRAAPGQAAEKLFGKLACSLLCGSSPSGETGELIKVTPETYIRAESDRTFHNIQALADDVNRFYNISKPTPLDARTVIRMNRDTLYSGVIIDTAKGAAVTLPNVPAGRSIAASWQRGSRWLPLRRVTSLSSRRYAIALLVASLFG